MQHDDKATDAVADSQNHPDREARVTSDDMPVAVGRVEHSEGLCGGFSAWFFEQVAFDEVRNPVLPLRHGPPLLGDE